MPKEFLILLARSVKGGVVDPGQENGDPQRSHSLCPQSTACHVEIRAGEVLLVGLED